MQNEKYWNFKGRASVFTYVSFFPKFLQINNNIPYSLEAQVVGTALLQVCCRFVTKFRLFTCVVAFLLLGVLKLSTSCLTFYSELLTLIKTRSFILNSYFTYILLSFSLNVHGFLFLSEGNSSICTSLD